MKRRRRMKRRRHEESRRDFQIADDFGLNVFVVCEQRVLSSYLAHFPSISNFELMLLRTNYVSIDSQTTHITSSK
jgi:hypothetical protein